jgi:hypothetical protein
MPNRVFVLYAVLAGVVGSVLGPLLAQDDGIHWLDNYGEAIREARRTQKPIFLEFRCEP